MPGVVLGTQETIINQTYFLLFTKFTILWGSLSSSFEQKLKNNPRYCEPKPVKKGTQPYLGDKGGLLRGSNGEAES